MLEIFYINLRENVGIFIYFDQIKRIFIEKM